MNARPATDERNPRQWPILLALLGLDAFVLGALAALLVVNRMLQNAVDVYATRNMDAASTVLDLLDDLLVYLLPVAGILLTLVLITIAVGAWQMARSETVRYGVTVLALAALLLYAAGVGAWLWRAAATPPVPPTTPTATPAASGALAQDARPGFRSRSDDAPHIERQGDQADGSHGQHEQDAGHVEQCAAVERGIGDQQAGPGEQDNAHEEQPRAG